MSSGRRATSSWARCAQHSACFLTVVCSSYNTPPALLRSQAASQSDSISSCLALLQEAVLVKVHVRLDICCFWGWIACALSCSFVCSFLWRLLLSAHRTVLLHGRLLLGQLHLWFGLGHNRVTSREQLLGSQTKTSKEKEPWIPGTIVKAQNNYETNTKLFAYKNLPFKSANV